MIWEWFHKAPIIDVRLFKSFNFASANVMMFMLGIMLFSSLVLMPQFLQTLLGYTAELAGLALSAGGLDPAVRDAGHGPVDHENSGAPPDRLWLAGIVHCHVLFHAADRPADEFHARPRGCASLR